MGHGVHHVAREGEVWTLAEVGMLIERMGQEVRKVKMLRAGTITPERHDAAKDFQAEFIIANLDPAPGPCRSCGCRARDGSRS